MHIRHMAQVGLFAALGCVCAWLAVPVGDVAITMQTFCVFLTLELLGGKRGSLAILVYLLLGAVGLPVFSGFRGGFGALFGVTGGYLVGFLATGLIYWLITAISPKHRLIGLLAGLTACYLFGTLWFYFGYLQGASTLGFSAIVAKCVLPYLIPDLCKLAFAWYLAKKLRRFVY